MRRPPRDFPAARRIFPLIGWGGLVFRTDATTRMLTGGSAHHLPSWRRGETKLIIFAFVIGAFLIVTGGIAALLLLGIGDWK